MDRALTLILHNVRSAYNVSAIFRLADGAGVSALYLTGYTPRPHDGASLFMTAAQKMIAKTALGAEQSVSWQHVRSVATVIATLKNDGVQVIALEQSARSSDYKKFRPRFPLAMIVGNEPRGLDARTLAKCDAAIDIPMRGTKNSLNVAVACGIAVYELCAHE